MSDGAKVKPEIDDVAEGVIVIAVGLPESSKKGHDQIKMFVRTTDFGMCKVWETFADTECKSGRNIGESFKVARLAEYGLDDVIDASQLKGRGCVIEYRQMLDEDGDPAVNKETGKLIQNWGMEQLLS